MIAVPVAAATALGIAASPVVLVGDALAGLAATLGLDASSGRSRLTSEPGAPAASYVLARWDW
jgi:hypothetical protein